jgi:hypothetical protein
VVQQADVDAHPWPAQTSLLSERLVEPKIQLFWKEGSRVAPERLSAKDGQGAEGYCSTAETTLVTELG